jgi:hypothetical protein
VPTIALVPTSQQQLHCQTERLAREWVVTFAELYSVNLADRGPRSVNLWVSALVDLEPAVLDAACKRAMQRCKFFPTPAEVRAGIKSAAENATKRAAEIAWQSVLDLRRLHWNPDLPDTLSHELARLPEQTRQAARAAGVFRDFESVEDLHVWAKKRFIESFVTWAELEQDQFLLLDGELKRLLAGVAETKSLPASESYEAMRERGLAYAAELRASPSDIPRRPDPPRPRPQQTRSIEEQKRILRERGLLPESEGLQTSAISG